MAIGGEVSGQKKIFVEEAEFTVPKHTRTYVLPLICAELGEINAFLSKHEYVKENVTVVRQDDGSEKRLVSYVVPSHKFLNSDDQKEPVSVDFLYVLSRDATGISCVELCPRGCPYVKAGVLPCFSCLRLVPPCVSLFHMCEYVASKGSRVMSF